MTHRLVGRHMIRFAIVAAIAGTLFAFPHINASVRNAEAKTFVIGVSNGLVGNGWREEMKCSVKAEVGKEAPGSTVTISESNLDTAAQVSGFRNLISAGANAIVVDPPDAKSMNGVIQEAVGRGVTVVVVDQLVSSSAPYQAENNQFRYGYRGAYWLAQTLHGHGNIVLLRGIAGAPADTDRQNGIKAALKHFPGIHIVASSYTNWNFATASQQMLALLRSGKRIDGVWTSGVDYTVVNAFQTAHKKFVPIVGADNKGFVHQLVTLRSKGLVGAVVTNPPPIGGVGAEIALKVLRGGHPAKVLKLRPDLWDNVNNLATLQAHDITRVPPTYAVDWGVSPYTHYTLNQLLACK